MNDQAQQQLAAIHERHEKATADAIETFKQRHPHWNIPTEDEIASCYEAYFGDGEVKFLLTLLADAERRADEIEHDSDILLGVEWQRSVKAANGDPEAAREHRIAALVADLAEATERAEQAAAARQAEIVAWLRERANAIAVANRESGGDYRLAAQANELDDAADAIERGEFREKS